MPRVIRAGLVQAGIGRDAPEDIQMLRQLMLDKHLALIEEASTRGVEVLCLQELFTSPYFPPSRTIAGASWRSASRKARQSG